jgi:hypothetical protein
MRRALYTGDHQQYRETVREFIAREVACTTSGGSGTG